MLGVLGVGASADMDAVEGGEGWIVDDEEDPKEMLPSLEA